MAVQSCPGRPPNYPEFNVLSLTALRKLLPHLFFPTSELISFVKVNNTEAEILTLPGSLYVIIFTIVFQRFRQYQ